MKNNLFITLTTAALLTAAFFTGCGSTDTGKSADNKSEVTTAVGHLTLSVNPEIRISYNKDGRVTEITGTNADGRDIVDDYDDYIGKYCGRVLTELVDEIHEAGYFVEEADGSQKQIVVELEEGSKLPDDDFLDELSGNVQQAVSRLDLASDVVVRDDDDYEDTDYGTDSDGATDYFDDEDYVDTDYGPDNDGVTDYESTQSAVNGDSNYDDTDYGPNNDGVTDYDDTDYGVNNDGVTDYAPPATQAPAVQAPAGGDSGYGDSGYDAGSNYGDSGYDD